MYMNRWIVFRRFLLISLARCDNGNPPTTESMHHLKTDGERIFVLNLNLFQIVALTQHTPLASESFKHNVQNTGRLVSFTISKVAK